MIEFEFGTSVRASEHHAMLVPISSIVSVEPWPDTTEARVTLVDGRVLWVPEGYVALVARIREALDHGMFPWDTGALMFEPEPPSKLTPRLRARILREELEYRLDQLESLERSITDTTGADNRERMRADAVAVAIAHVRQAMDALAVASQE